MNLDQFISKTAGIEEFLKKEATRILVDNEQVIALQNEERLFKTGRDINGNIIGRYTDATVKKRKRAGKPVPSDLHYTSLWAGDFFAGIDVSVKDVDSVEIKSTFKDYPEMESRNPNYLGLDKDEADFMSEKVAEELVNSLVKYYT